MANLSIHFVYLILYETKLSSDAYGGIRISQELEHIELDGDEEDDEPVFVLTDEWREFFAKSEAKRKLGNSLHTYSLVMQFMCA
ncbi:hypothetical protein L195_g017623 [Trifolium pratense]|uniref:Uncharacterized protein n=1 Tax=Trifolium pratense TaxID=57577 RepID=A0A2K3MUI7_TRIPR|nr:hypothetical protein L195_g017623 [Trifolium pratense]